MGTVFYGNFERKKALDYYGDFEKTISLDYGRLDDIINEASEASSMMQDYIDDLSKIVSCYGDVSGGSSENLSNSEYYVNNKIKALTAKKSTYSLFANNVSAFSKFASEKDDYVAKTISEAKKYFVDQHDYIKSDWWTSIKEWFIDLKYSCPIFDAIGNLINNIAEGISSLIDDLVYWYKCNGGKEIIGVVLAFAGAIAAVVLAVLAFPASGFVAVCAFFGAAITAANAIYNIISSFQAYDAITKEEPEPALAKIYSDQDTIQDWLRNTDFENNVLNHIFYGLAFTLDFVKTVCDVVA
ncbi:MAG: hypothetical protein K6F93_07655, partial [Lachnospiraceae bacterium]|nr:hypothetical protein [Lachnospiraceae bacterium]